MDDLSSYIYGTKMRPLEHGDGGNLCLLKLYAKSMRRLLTLPPRLATGWDDLAHLLRWLVRRP